MKRTITVFLIGLFILAPVCKSFADDIQDRIDDLQGQIDELKKQNDKNKVGSKLPVEIYGLVDAQFNIGTARTQMYGGLNSVAVQSRVMNRDAAGGGRHTWFGATPQNSRLGLNWTGSQLSENYTMKGLFEIDFVNVLNQTSYGTSPIPRIRHLYAELLHKERWSLVFGQTWDIFSPLNTASLNLGGNLWYQGNLGFRRPQLRFGYNFKIDDKNSIKTSISANLPANVDDLTNVGISSGIPLGEALVQYVHKMKHGDMIAAASGALGANTIKGGYRKMTGIAGSLHIPFHRFFKLSGEVQYGQDMGIFLSYVNSTGNEYGGRDLAVWGQIASQWHERFDTAVGYAVDNIKASKVAVGNVERNQIAFANFRVFPFKPFYIGFEYEYMRTNYKGSGTTPASIFLSTFVYNF